MDNENARFLLAAYRSNQADAGDTVFAEAIALTQVDPDLRVWFAREQRGDRAIAKVMREIRAPVELRDQILRGAALSERRPFQRRLALAGLAAAASIALLIYMLWPTARVRSFDSIVAQACSESRQPLSLRFYATGSHEVLAWLQREHVPVPQQLPRALAALPTIGCRTVEWSGVPASEVCFRAAGLGGTDSAGPAEPTLHLFTVNQSSCSGGGAGRTPVVFARDGMAVATWRDRSHFYILVGDLREDDLRRLLLSDATVFALAPQRLLRADNIRDI